MRSESPLFALSWTLFHSIDEKSPLYGRTREELEAMDASFVVTLRGHDESLAQSVSARRSYRLGNVRWDHRYEDILSADDSGRVTIDYGKFHHSSPIGTEEVGQ